MESLRFRKALLNISNMLSSQDLELLKFLCEIDVPSARMERVRSGTDLFNALEERGKLAAKNLGFLVDILRSIGRHQLIETHLKNQGFVTTPTSLAFGGPGGKIGGQCLQYLFRECLVKIAQNLTSTEVNDVKYMYGAHLQMSQDRVFSATQLFTLLQQRQLLTPTDMHVLYDGLCHVNRHDLALLVNEFLVKTGQPAFKDDQQGMIISHQGRPGHHNPSPVQETTPASCHANPNAGWFPPVQYQQHGGYGYSAPPPHEVSRTSSGNSSLSSDANSSPSTLPTTTKDYPPDHHGGHGAIVGDMQFTLQSEKMEIVPSVDPNFQRMTGGYPPPTGGYPPAPVGYQQPIGGYAPFAGGYQQPPPPQRYLSGDIKPFGLEFDVFETKSAESASSLSTSEVEQRKLLEDLAMKHGALVRKEEEITKLRFKLEEANSDKSKVYSEKLGEAEQFKQNIRELEKMLKTKNEEVNGLVYELNLFHSQMEVMQAARPIDEKEFYRLDRNPHGICVIINNHKFHHPTDPDKAHSDRGGAEVDQKNLQLTFQYLRYKVEVYENLTNTQMTELMLDVARRNHANYDSFICCILTHGEENSVHGADSIPVSLFDLTGVMKLCSTLINKPKMFFIQACRGDQEDKGHKLDEEVIQRDSGPKAPPLTHTIPQEADFFFGYATPLGNAAYRSRRHGSWYISELCKVLTMHAYTSNLSNMMRKVNDNICRAFTKEGYKQTSEFVDRLRKGVHFFHFSKVQQQV